ncbi:YtpI family protein [Flavobacterium anhuiense]|uniref:YtpI family protein n=1 Tax=Flavobacterium anhuiense TaxID=459526 RepID=UPI000E6C4F44|nr:YtpI family protein [Flavobacterium anhuiense]
MIKQEIELIIENYSNNKKLTENELFLLLENVLDTVISQGKFENNAQSFYNYANYIRIKNMVLDSSLGIPEILIPKIKIIIPIERRVLEKECKTRIYLGVFMVFFSIVCYLLFQNEFGVTPIFFIIGLLLFGLFSLFNGINSLSKFKKNV